MHTYTVPRPAESNNHCSYFPSVLFDSAPMVDNQFYDSVPQWTTTPYGLLTPPQFNIPFPTNHYIQPLQPQPQQPLYNHFQQQSFQHSSLQDFQLPQQHISQPQDFVLSPSAIPLRSGYYTPRASITSIPSLPSPPVSTLTQSQIQTPQFQLREHIDQSYSNNMPSHITTWIPTIPFVDSDVTNSLGSIEPSTSTSSNASERTCTPFVSKLSYLLDNPDLFGDVIKWDRSGTSFIVTPSEKFTTEVLPSIFSHSSIPAFTRQLNTYGFNRINRAQLIHIFRPPLHSATPVKQLSAWYHPLLTRANPSTMILLSPKQSKSKTTSESMLKKRRTSLPGSSEVENLTPYSRYIEGGYGGEEGMDKRRKMSMY